MDNNKIPDRLIDYISSNLEGCYTHDDIDIFFKNKYKINITDKNFGSKSKRIKAELMNLNGKKDINQLKVLGEFVSIFIDKENCFIDNNEIKEEFKEKLKEFQLEYKIDSHDYNGNIVRINSNNIDITQLSNLNVDYAIEQINKCKEKINSKDYDGSINNARTLLEAIFKKILQEIDNVNYEKNNNKGDINELYNLIKNKLNLNPSKIDNMIFKKILSSLINIINSIKEIADNGGSDRHASDNQINNSCSAKGYKIDERHAKLLVNSALTVSEFIVSVYNNKFKNKEN